LLNRDGIDSEVRRADVAVTGDDDYDGWIERSLDYEEAGSS
jgi:hypothetical protein